MAPTRRSRERIHSTVRIWSSLTTGLVTMLALASCAVMFNGTTQTVPITSIPDRAEVFVDGVSMGFTPLELELARDRAYEIDVRLGSQTRSFSLRGEVQGAMVGLDLVPVAVAGGIGLAGAAVATVFDGPNNVLPITLVLVGISLAPIGVDFGTGAIYRLAPGEIVAVFE